MTDEEKKAAEEKAAAEADAAFNAKLNAAVTAHAKRLEERFNKALDEKLAKLAPPKTDDKPDEKPAGGAKTDPEVARLREQVEKLTKQSADAEAARMKAEQKAARDATHTALREQLDGLGVKGPKARAVIHDLEASGQLRLNTETGAYELVVKRARTKGARAEELTYDDLGAGLKDWSQTDDAKEFLPAQQSAQQQGARRAPGALPPRVPGPQGDANSARRASPADAARTLDSLGITEAAAFGDD